MNRNEFEQAARKQNADRNAQVADARSSGAACDLVTMFAFGGETYCRTHRVMGRCDYGKSYQGFDRNGRAITMTVPEGGAR